MGPRAAGSGDPALQSGAALLGAAALLLAGCATPGPLHVYSLSPAGERSVVDRGDNRTAKVPSFLKSDERVSGFAYDPFTDHFFLRLAPGNLIRVVDRPARAIKRELTLTDAPKNTGGDLAVRPRDGHLFLLQPGDTTVIETTRLGKTVRTIRLAGLDAPPTGIACDTVQERLLVLGADGRRVTVHDVTGAQTGSLTLDRAVGSSLAFDSEKRELFAPLREARTGIGVFDFRGQLVRTEPGEGEFVDVGPRSFVRVF